MEVISVQKELPLQKKWLVKTDLVFLVQILTGAVTEYFQKTTRLIFYSDFNGVFLSFRQYFVLRMVW